MAYRLASYAYLQSFMKSLDKVSSSDEKGVALGHLLDSVSSRMSKYIYRSGVYSLAQGTSDGTSSPLENYGIEHYGNWKRNIIRLKRFLGLVSITSVVDNGVGQAVDASEYNVDYANAIIYRNVGSFSSLFGAVQVIYASGYPLTGAGDTACLQAPDDLQAACAEQVAYEFTKREPGGVPIGASTVSRPDGSLSVTLTPWTKMAADVLDSYRR